MINCKLNVSDSLSKLKITLVNSSKKGSAGLGKYRV